MEIRDKIIRFMTGRYGNDTLNRALTIIALVFFFASLLWKPLYIVSLLLMVLVPLRMFSRNINRRAAEGKAYEKIKGRIVDNLISLKHLTIGTKTHCYFRCPSCKKIVRVPRGKGKVIIHCSNCPTSYTEKT
jgi:predicted membrane protein